MTIAKRDNLKWWQSALVRVIAILAAFTVVSIISIIIAKQNPFKIIGTMFKGIFGYVGKDGKWVSHNLWVFLNELAILLGMSLAITPAFKMKFWNCGAEGQVLMGALATTMCMFYIGDAVPYPILVILMIVTSSLAGAIWGVIPSIFKAKWNTNETLFTLMMNYIAIQLISFFLKVEATDGSGVLKNMPQFRFPKLFDQNYLLTIIVIAVMCAAMFVYLRYSKQGFEISVVGESENTAKYIGINVKTVIIRTLVISGGLCGIVGLMLVANGSCTITTDLAGGQGFTAIMVSWLAKFNPLYMILTSGLVAFLNRGMHEVTVDFRLDSALCDIMVAIILFFIIGCEFFINYKIIFHRKSKEETK